MNQVLVFILLHLQEQESLIYNESKMSSETKV